METFKEMDDALLAERIGCDDRSAFDELYNRHRKRTFGFIRARVYNDADAHDIAQDAWGRIWQQRRAYEAERGDFGAFAMRLTISAVADYYRARRTRQERELLFSEVLARFPEFAQDGDVEEALATENLPQRTWSEAERGRPDVSQVRGIPGIAPQSIWRRQPASPVARCWLL